MRNDFKPGDRALIIGLQFDVDMNGAIVTVVSGLKRLTVTHWGVGTKTEVFHSIESRDHVKHVIRPRFLIRIPPDDETERQITGKTLADHRFQY